jgi:hypothetical protein
VATPEAPTAGTISAPLLANPNWFILVRSNTRLAKSRIEEYRHECESRSGRTIDARHRL